jgi:hypothetical protein
MAARDSSWKAKGLPALGYTPGPPPLNARRPPPPGEGWRGPCMEGRRRRTLPPGPPGSTIRAVGLNGRVRDGNGCVPHAIATDHRSCGRFGFGPCGHLRRGLPRPEFFGQRGSKESAPGRPLTCAGASSGRAVAASRRPTPQVGGRPRRSSSRRSSSLETGRKAGQASRGISTARLHVSPRFHLPPIDVIVSHAPSGALRPGSAHLGVGFPLRCFQRLSRPDVATRRCRWRDNRYTSGRSVPVLSY